MHRFTVLVFVLVIANVQSLNNGLALTPPLGWANWNGFGCNYDDSTIRKMADALVSTGMAALGYNQIIIQECIVPAGHRDPSTQELIPDPVKFPYGIANLVDYIHSKGLKAGIYTDVGPQTCAGYEGSYNHEQVDAKTFASWGLDFVEEDACNKPSDHSYEELYQRMRDAINATGRPIVFYACVWGQENVYQWGPETANLWRTTSDICAPNAANWAGVVNNFYGNAQHPEVSGPGQWQDPDMLVVGMSGLTSNEWRSHFSLWAISAAPLWAGIDLTTMPSDAKTIFLNNEVVAVDQDKLGKAATRARSTSSLEGQPRDPTPPGHNINSLQDCQDTAAWAFNSSDLSLRSMNECISIESCGMTAGTPAIMWECVGQSGGCPKNQQWAILDAGVANAKLYQSLLSSQCLAASSASWGNVVTQQPCNKSSPLQQFIQQTDGTLKLNSGDNLCLGWNGASTSGEAWVKPLSSTNGQKVLAVVLFNPDNTNNASIHIAWNDIGLDGTKPASVRDLWTHTDLGNFTSFNSTVVPHGVTMVKIVQ